MCLTYVFALFVDGKSSTIVQVNIYLRSINGIDDYKMVRHIRINRELWRKKVSVEMSSADGQSFPIYLTRAQSYPAGKLLREINLILQNERLEGFVTGCFSHFFRNFQFSWLTGSSGTTRGWFSTTLEVRIAVKVDPILIFAGKSCFFRIRDKQFSITAVFPEFKGNSSTWLWPIRRRFGSRTLFFGTKRRDIFTPSS